MASGSGKMAKKGGCGEKISKKPLPKSENRYIVKQNDDKKKKGQFYEQQYIQ